VEILTTFDVRVKATVDGVQTETGYGRTRTRGGGLTGATIVEGAFGGRLEQGGHGALGTLPENDRCGNKLKVSHARGGTGIRRGWGSAKVGGTVHLNQYKGRM